MEICQGGLLLLYAKKIPLKKVAELLGATEGTILKWKREGAFLPETFVKLGPSENSDLYALEVKLEETLKAWNRKGNGRGKPL